MSSPRATIKSSTTDSVNEPCATSTPGSESVGSCLRSAREAQAVSEKEAAQQLQMMVTDLRAIEADRYSVSANDESLRGYLREYAKLLLLDPDSILASYDRQAGLCPQRAINRIDDGTPVNATFLGSLLTGSLVSITVLLGLLVLMQFTRASRFDVPLATDRDNRDVAAHPLDKSQLTVAAGQTADLAATMIVGPNAVTPVAAEEPPELANASQLEATSADASANAVEARADDELSFRFAKDCWVEVYDANEKRLIAEIRKAGGSLKLSGRSPFRVLVGHSREVVLQFNDQPVDIEKIDRSYSTLFTVGRANNDPEEPVVKTIRRKVQIFPATEPAEIASETTLALG